MVKNNIVLYGNDVQRNLNYLVDEKQFKPIDQEQIYGIGIMEMYKDVFAKTKPEHKDQLLNDLIHKYLPLHLNQNVAVGADTVLYGLDKQLKQGNNVIYNPFNQFDIDRYKQKGIYVINTEGIDYNPQFQLAQEDYTIDRNIDLKRQWDIFFDMLK